MSPSTLFRWRSIRPPLPRTPWALPSHMPWLMALKTNIGVKQTFTSMQLAIFVTGSDTGRTPTTISSGLLHSRTSRMSLEALGLLKTPSKAKVAKVTLLSKASHASSSSSARAVLLVRVGSASYSLFLFFFQQV
ncbi:hypothetical protein KFK09_013331 [Dendrobium nobile]|uniref:Uncharacterized protein n=1 Tax=Dendrobium nobile TaxID=94219 RepID=A0A8T3BCT3_DENNO|nr:hypothetical protein KFK09_013331 [Dendrobium nobile]